MEQQPSVPQGEASYLFQVNLGGMIDLLSNHLYSTPDVFLRELLQNAVDAIAAKHNRADAQAQRIADSVTLTLSTQNGQPLLAFADTGTGLTEAEIHRFLAVIGQSSKHDLLQGTVQEDYIGRFGIGLLSCFLVADCIRVQTCSITEPTRSLEWCGNPDGTYTIAPCAPLPHPGTVVLLQPKEGCERYFTAETLQTLVPYYGLPLPVPILLTQPDGTVTRLNPPFAAEQSDRAQAMKLGETLFHTSFLDYIPLVSKSGRFSGVAFVLAEETAPTAKQTHRIYLKQMLLTEDGSRLLPKWAFFLRCFLNTNGLRPTAAREDFYEDEALLQAREELADCIADYLRQLAVENPPMLQKIVRTHRLAVQSVAVEDDSLYRTFFPFLTFETSFGVVTGQALVDGSEEIVYTNYLDEFRQVSAIFLARGALLVNAGYTYVRQLLERLPLLNDTAVVRQLRLQAIDTMLADATLANPAQALCLLAECNRTLQPFDCVAAIKAFSPAELPVLYTINEDAMLLRDIRHALETADTMFTGMLEAFADEYHVGAMAKLYLNADNPLMQRLMAVRDSDRLRCCIEILYVQSLLTGGYPMRNHEMQLLNENLLQLLDWSIS